MSSGERAEAELTCLVRRSPSRKQPLRVTLTVMPSGERLPRAALSALDWLHVLKVE
jgi:hypothetical protein